jgi:RNA polymerase sigma-70 factor (ECF subfamily)
VSFLKDIAATLAEITIGFLEEAFRTHYEGLHRYAYTLLKDNEAARDAVQQVFTRVWEQRRTIRLRSSARAYLYRALHNYCLNLKTRSRRPEPLSAEEHEDVHLTEADMRVEYKELQAAVDRAIEALPPQCRLIFLKTRLEGRRYADIAEEQGISIKTVEAQVSKALRLLRTSLGLAGMIGYCINFCQCLLNRNW